MQFKSNVSSCTKLAIKLKVHFYYRYCSKCVTSAFICLQSQVLFQHEHEQKKLGRHVSFSSTCFYYYKKHPNNGNKICLLLSSACFQQHSHD